MIAYEKDMIDTNWVSPPSETILRLMYQKGINIHLFRIKTGLSVEQFLDLLYDKINLDKQIVAILSDVLGGSESFWINRYEQFNNQLCESNNLVLSENLSFLKNLSDIRQTSIDGLLYSFKVSTFEHLITDYVHNPRIMYSKSQRLEPSLVNIANWIRNCELVAEEVVLRQPVPVFNSNFLEDNLGEILALSKINSVDKILNKLKDILLQAGVVLVLSSSITGTGVSGFTKKLLKKYRIIVVTDRYKNNAAFWFTLLHEIAHCILHPINQPIIHYSDEEFVLASLPTNNTFDEEEANKYVEQLLFSEEFMQDLRNSSQSYRSIMRLGVKYDISAALIVAQVHRKKIAPHSYYRKVYKAVRFDSIF